MLLFCLLVIIWFVVCGCAVVCCLVGSLYCLYFVFCWFDCLMLFGFAALVVY